MSINNDFICHCADWRFTYAFFIVDHIREKVCRDLPFYGEIDGKKYCVLHYPSKSKTADFDKIYQERIKEENWDFRMVYFPSQIKFGLEDKKEFHNDANFSYSTFADYVIFRYCKFYGSFEFFDSKFLNDAIFIYSEFIGPIRFNSVDFQKQCDFSGVKFHENSSPTFEQTKFKIGLFSSAKFHSEVWFSKAVFTDHANFARTEFFSKADFKEITLPENKENQFKSSIFHSSVNFENSKLFNANFSSSKFSLSANSTFNSINFRNCIFSTVNFANAEFHKSVVFFKTSFQTAHFEGATFKSNAQFQETVFTEDVFFDGTEFGSRDGNRITSGQAHFDGAHFKEDSRVFFNNTWFSYHAHFNYVKFSGYVFFTGNEDNPVFDSIFENHAFGHLLKVSESTFDKPEKVYFHTVRLRPSWFVNLFIDLRKCNFVNIEWSDENRKPITIQGELKNLGERFYKINSKKLLIIVFRQLAENAETNSRFEEASKFRQMAFETEWLDKNASVDNWVNNILNANETLKSTFGTSEAKVDMLAPLKATVQLIYQFLFNFDFLHPLYRILSFYGESWRRAFIVLSFIVVFSGILFVTPLCTFVKDRHGLGGWEAFFYSLRVAALQRPEPQPENDFAKGIITIEGIFAPIQVALLALAIRRKFMR